MMNSKQQQLWKDRVDKQIVLVDADSKPANCATQISLPVMILKDAIYKVCSLTNHSLYFMLCSQFDLTNGLSHEPLLLDGGFLRWYQTYSPYCIGKVAKKVSVYMIPCRLVI